MDQLKKLNSIKILIALESISLFYKIIVLQLFYILKISNGLYFFKYQEVDKYLNNNLKKLFLHNLSNLLVSEFVILRSAHLV